MVIWHAQRKKKPSGGLFRRLRDKRKYELGRPAAMTTVSDKIKVTKIKVRSANVKYRALELSSANVFDKKTKKYTNVKIKKVHENLSSRHFARMGVMTKGAIIETEKGKAKITNRPGQEGFINAVLID